MPKPMGHYRLTSKAAGDDITLSRYVRDDRATAPRRKHQPKLPGLETAFIQEARTKFPTTVRPVSAMKHLLVSGHSNVKIGRDVRKGHLRGYWLYTLSLEERKTCPRSCGHWQSCYGNAMPFAKRIDHTDPEFLNRLDAEITALLAVRGRAGLLVRLHALGDFFSVPYVWFWAERLRQHPRLAIYGYTARTPIGGYTARTPIGGDRPQFLDAIGNAIAALNAEFPGRCMIRFSNGRLPTMSTASIGSPESCPPNAFICPEQTAKTMCCATCGACWGTTKNVAFLEH